MRHVHATCYSCFSALYIILGKGLGTCTWTWRYVCVCVCVCVKTSHLFISLKRDWTCKRGCEHACTQVCVSVGVHACVTLMRSIECPCVCVCMDLVWVCVRECVPPPPVPPCAVGSAGNVTPVPGIAASLDPGNSDDRNRRLLPLRRTHCLATGSPHTRPKPFLKASSSFAAVPACLLFLPLLLFLLIISKCPFVPFETLSSSHGLLLFLLFLPLAH